MIFYADNQCYPLVEVRLTRCSALLVYQSKALRNSLIEQIAFKNDQIICSMPACYSAYDRVLGKTTLFTVFGSAVSGMNHKYRLLAHSFGRNPH